MKIFNSFPSIRIIVLLTTLIAIPLKSTAAIDLDFSGVFEKDNDVVLLNFSVEAESTITIFSSSWDDGGFDPILGIWNIDGDLVDEQDDGDFKGSTLSNGVLYNHDIFDSYFEIVLSAGEYRASITQYDNFSVGLNLSEGFLYDDNPNFTFENGWGSQANFNGVFGENDSDEDPRAGAWAFHILNVEEVAVVPVPAAVWLFGSGLIALVSGRIRRKTL